MKDKSCFNINKQKNKWITKYLTCTNILKVNHNTYETTAQGLYTYMLRWFRTYFTSDRYHEKMINEREEILSKGRKSKKENNMPLWWSCFWNILLLYSWSHLKTFVLCVYVNFKLKLCILKETTETLYMIFYLQWIKFQSSIQSYILVLY